MIDDQSIMELTGCQRSEIAARVQREGSLGSILTSSGNEYLCVADQAYIEPTVPTGDARDYELVTIPQD